MPLISTCRKSVPLLIILVTVLFFCPVAVGSYQATHGPTSTLKEFLSSLLLRVLIGLLAHIGLRLAAVCTQAHFSLAANTLLNLVSGPPPALRC
jgi:uncharacterized membrane protein (DUF441 family)